jgi:hypothetical protein
MSTNQSDDFRKLSKAYTDRQKQEVSRKLEKTQAGVRKQEAEKVVLARAAPPPMFTQKELEAIHQALSFTDGEGCLHMPGRVPSRGHEIMFCRELIAKAAKLAGVE